MKNKYVKRFLKILILCIGFLIGFKCYYLYKYSVSSRTIKNYDNYVKFLSNTETLSINTKKEENVDYLEFNNIKIRNDWNNSLELIENTTYSHKYVKYDENKNMEYSIWLGGQEENTLETLINDSKESSGRMYIKYYEENNVYDLVSLLKYLSKNKDKKVNLLTSINEIKWYYIVNVISAAIFENAEHLKFIDGAYQGIKFTYKTNNQTSILINKGGKTYGITFFGLDYFTDDYVLELLETLIIE